MKALPSLIILCCSLVMLNSCQHDLTGQANSLAEGTLAKTSTGNCSPISLGGTFIRNSMLTVSNYMDVQVNFTATGNYDIKSDTINGYTFRGTGQVATGGLTTIRLQGNGTPLVAGTDVFTIHFGTSVCQANVIVSTTGAAFTLGGAGGACMGATLWGTYTAGTALIGTNTVTLQVNVTALGAYSISTDIVNGMQFSAGGAFTTTGPQTVVLAGVGSPSAAGPFSFHAGAASNCTFNLTVVPGTGSLATITTTAATGITCSVASSGGNITADGGSMITARGICMATTHNPAVGQGTTVNGTGIGTFTSSMSGLTVNTTYYVRAYAVNSAGTAYGNEISFSTTATCPLVSIYVCGRDDIHNIAGDIPAIKVWQRPGGAGSFTGTNLTVGGNISTGAANCVYAAPSGVYVAGADAQTAFYWQNNVSHQIGITPTAPFFYTSSANAVTGAGATIYIAGEQSNIATLWTNDVAAPVASPAAQYHDKTSYAKDVFVSGSDIYVGGTQTTGSGQYLATVWKNGNPTFLTNGSISTDVNSVFVSGNDVYACGTEGSTATPRPKLWKNGVEIPLMISGTLTTGYANAVFVNGTDVYVAATIYSGTSPDKYALYWKNGVPVYLTTNPDSGNAANDIKVVNNIVYVAGATTSTFANSVAMVWINGFGTNLTSGGTDAYAYSIDVR